MISSAGPAGERPSLAELTRLFLRIGVLSFGGAAGQIAMMHSAIVDEKKWLDERRFLNALNYCMLLPGPEAQQLATYIGWLLHGVRGGLIAGVLFILPGAMLMLGLSFLYVMGSGLTLVDGAFLGIKAAVIAIILQALIKIGKRGLSGRLAWALAVIAFVLMLFLDVPFPIIVIGAGLIAALFTVQDRAAVVTEPLARTPPRSTWRIALACLAAWWLPIAAAALLLGLDHRLTEIGLFFSQLAVVTFGGAYAVLAYLVQSAVDFGWVTTEQMMAGLGLAETTPGPTILVNQFVAFIAGQGVPGPLPVWVAAVLAAMMASWATFAPSFLWIFAGAPYVERLGRYPAIAAALSGITAAVVGVIAYVALWFALHVLFGGVTQSAAGLFRWIGVDPSTLKLIPAALALIAIGLVFRLRLGVPATVGIMAVAGMAARVLLPQ